MSWQKHSWCQHWQEPAGKGGNLWIIITHPSHSLRDAWHRELRPLWLCICAKGKNTKKLEIKEQREKEEENIGNCHSCQEESDSAGMRGLIVKVICSGMLLLTGKVSERSGSHVEITCRKLGILLSMKSGWFLPLKFNLWWIISYINCRMCSGFSGT